MTNVPGPKVPLIMAGQKITSYIVRHSPELDKTHTAHTTNTAHTAHGPHMTQAKMTPIL